MGEMASRAQLDTLNAGRETIRKSSTSWRRVTDGNPCGFCAMLVSRGPVYTSERGAGAGGDYHTHCGCTVEPFEGSFGDWEPTADEQRFIDAYEEVHQGGMTGRDTADLMDELLHQASAYGDMGDDELAALLEQFLESGDMDNFEKIAKLVDAREDAARAAAEAFKPDPWDFDNKATYEWFAKASQSEQDKFVAGLRNQDDFWRGQYTFETGKSARAVTMTEKQLRAEYELWLNAEINRLQSSVDIPNLLKSGSRLKNEADLWRVNDITALANAPEELKLYWQSTGGRQTFSRFKAIMKDDGVRAVTEAMAKGVQSW